MEEENKQITGIFVDKREGSEYNIFPTSNEKEDIKAWRIKGV
jgi:hypothetical protein